MQHQDAFAAVKDDTGETDEIFLFHRLADHSEGFVGDLVVRRDVIGFVEIDFVNLAARHEGLDVDGVGALERHLVELFVLDQDVAPLFYLIALDPIFLLDRTGTRLELVTDDAQRRVLQEGFGTMPAVQHLRSPWINAEEWPVSAADYLDHESWAILPDDFPVAR